MEPNASDTLVYDGGAVKALGDGRVGGYLIRFSDEDSPDLTGEFFSKATDTGLQDGDTLPVYYHHGCDPTVKNARIGRGTVRIDDVGVWIEAQLNLRTEYERAIYGMTEKGKMGWSSGAVSHLVSYSPHGKAVHIDAWPPGEGSLTPTPAEPRNAALPVKSLPAPPPLVGRRAKAESLDARQRAVHQAVNAAHPYSEVSPGAYVAEVFDEYAVLSYGQGFWKAPYTYDGSKATLAPREEWAAVVERREWAAAKARYLDFIAAEAASPPPDTNGAPAPPAAMADDTNTNTAPAAEAPPAAKAYTAEDLAATAKAAAEEALKAYQTAAAAEAAKPTLAAKYDGGAPAFNEHTAGTEKYDGASAADLAFMVETLDEAKRNGASRRGASPEARKALAQRLLSDEGRADDYRDARKAMKAAGLDAAKANELNYSTQADYGDEWVGQGYSSALWAAIRQESRLLASDRIPQFEFPAGAESLVIPLEGSDPIFYKIPQATSTATVDHGPAATVPPSKLGTDNATMTLAKLGARVLWTGEMEEDSMLPFVAQLRAQLARAGTEYLESAMIDGDTATAATTNINDIAGTPASTDYFLAFDGFRKLALVTNTANSRAGGALTTSDFLATVQMLGENGVNAEDMERVGIILSAGVSWKALELPEVKTRDVFSGATIENGRLTRLFGYDIETNHNMHLKGPYRHGGKAQAADGKIDQDTSADNTTGSILAVRWDQWRFGWRRRMTLETTRIPRADAYEIVALMRAGFMARDAEASAISFGITL